MGRTSTTSQPRDSTDSKEDWKGQEGIRSDPDSNSPGKDDDSDRKKSQAQRLLEFEMWTNADTLRDLEYSQRRSEKEQRRRERRKQYGKRCWKKVYLPAVMGMLSGTFLTLCATLPSLAGDTFLWNARGVLVVLGPILLGSGLLALMLAAGCTFQHDQEARRKSLSPPPEFLRSETEMQFRRMRPYSAVRSDSVITADLHCCPVDVDPCGNCVDDESGSFQSGNRTRTQSWKNSAVAGAHSPIVDCRYDSTARWVQFVSSAHCQCHFPLNQNCRSNVPSPTGQNCSSHLPSPTNQKYRNYPPSRTNQNCSSSFPSPIDQNPGVHLVSSTIRSQHLQEGRLFLDSANQDHSGSHSDLCVTRTRSLTSSGYHSTSDSTCGTVKYQTSHNISEGDRNHERYTLIRHGAGRFTNHLMVKNSVRECRVADTTENCRGSPDLVSEFTSPRLARQTRIPDTLHETLSSQTTSAPVVFSRPQLLH